MIKQYKISKKRWDVHENEECRWHCIETRIIPKEATLGILVSHVVVNRNHLHTVDLELNDKCRLECVYEWWEMRPGEAPTYVCAKIAYLRGQKSQYSSTFIAYLRQFLEIFTIFLSTYSIFEAWIWKKKKNNARNLSSSTHNGGTIWLIIPISKLTIRIPGDRSGEIVVWDLIRLSHFWQSHI